MLGEIAARKWLTCCVLKWVFGGFRVSIKLKYIWRVTLKKALLGLVSLLLVGNAQADQFPSNFSSLVQQLYHSVTSDDIELTRIANENLNKDLRTRKALCNELVVRHYFSTAPGMTQTNRAYSGVSPTASQCVNALTYTNSYTGDRGSRWYDWAGAHSGFWYEGSTGQKFSDKAIWNDSIKMPANSPYDVDQSGNPRVYDFQSVVFTERTGNSKYGWNQSHPEVQYIWGWDPKDESNAGGQVGTHVGFPFHVAKSTSTKEASCIVWVTPQEAFLECISMESEYWRRRTATGLTGFGQWSVSRWY